MALTFLGRAGKPDQSPEPPRHSYLPQANGSAVIGARRAAGDASGKIDDLQTALARLIDPSDDENIASPPPPQNQAQQGRPHSQQGRRQQAIQGQLGPSLNSVEAVAGDHLLAEVQATIARLESNRERPHSDPLLNQIDMLATEIERHQAELRTARTGLSRLQADNARLNTENERLRRMLKTLLSAIEADGKRASDTMERAQRRLRDLVPAGSEPAPVPTLRPAQRSKPETPE